MNTETIILTGVVFIVFTALLTLFSYLQQQSSWKGVIIDKEYEKAKVSDEGGTDEQFKLVCKTDAGKNITIGIFKEDYEFFTVGDRVEKKKGSYVPTRIE